MQMSGFSKVDMSALRPQWGHGGDGGVDDGGTGSAADHDSARRTAADAASGGRVARTERAPGAAPVSGVPARRGQGIGVPPPRTSELMALRFAEVESTFDYFRATRDYLEEHGKPMAFYSDRLSVFHVHARDRAENGPGLSQFGRAPRALNIDLLCARSPEAKGRVERTNGTLQDRLVKELRLLGLNDPIAAAPFLPEFRADYNRRFAKPPAVAYDAHRPLRPDDDLARIFTLQETRQISRQLTVHYKRDLYVLEDAVPTRRPRR